MSSPILFAILVVLGLAVVFLRKGSQPTALALIGGALVVLGVFGFAVSLL